MTINAVLEADLRSISAEARRRFPAVKDAAERGILKHADGSEEAVQLKVLQTVLTVLQSQLHPKDEESMAIILGICLRLAGSTRQLDCVHSTATATLRQAIALIFDRAASSEGLPVQCAPRQANRVWNTSEPGDISRIVMASRATEGEGAGRGGGEELETVVLKERVDDLSPAARMGLRLLEDLAALAAGQQAQWLHVPSLQRTFALEMLEYVVSHYATLFRRLTPYQQVLQHKLCALVMTSLRSTGSEEGDVGEPGYRRLVLRCVATLVRQHHAQLTTECEVFLLMLVKSVDQDLPLWHRILVLEVLRGFCVEPGTLQLIFNLFDMQPGNSSIVEEMAVALAHVVQSVQVPESSEESLAAVAGMFSSKARAGVEWSMDFDWAGNAVVAASEAHAITLAVEGLLGIVFTIALLTDEAMDDSHPYSASPPKSPLAPRKQPDAQAVAQGGGAAATDGASGVGGRQGEEGASPVSPPSPRVPGKHAALLAESDSHAPSPGLTRGLLALLGGMQEEGDGSEWVKKGAQDDEDAESRGGSAEGRVRGALEELCVRMVDAVWKTVLDALSIILARSQGEAVILEILRAYQAFTQACGALDLVDPRDEFLASLCRFTLVASPSMSTMAPPGQPFDSDRFQMPSSPSSAYLSPMRSLDALLGTESRGDLLASTMGSAAAASAAALGQGVPVLTPKNMHALRTLFNVSHRLCAVLGPSWELDVSASASTPSAGSRGSKELTGAPSSLQSDFSVLATLDAQLFQSTAHMDTAAVLALLAALRVVSNRALHSVTTGLGIAASGSSAAAAAAGTSAAAAAVASPLSTGALPSTLKMFAVERMLSVLSHNMHQVKAGALRILLHMLEVSPGHTCNRFHRAHFAAVLFLSHSNPTAVMGRDGLEQRHGEKLHSTWPTLLNLLRMVAATNDKDLVGLAFQVCGGGGGVCGASGGCEHISHVRGLLWTMADFFARGLDHATTTHRTATFPRYFNQCDLPASSSTSSAAPPLSSASAATSLPSTAPAAAASALKLPAGRMLDERSSALLLAVLCVMETRAKDGRPEVRNAAMRTLFQTVVSHGAKLPPASWAPLPLGPHLPPHRLRALPCESLRALAATASRDEAPGMEIVAAGGEECDDAGAPQPQHGAEAVGRDARHGSQWTRPPHPRLLLTAAYHGQFPGSAHASVVGLALHAKLFLVPPPLLCETMWGALLQFVEEGVLTGSREVSSAAASTLQTIMLTHATSIILTHATKVSIILTHATKVSIILTHATKVSIILTHATKVSIMLTLNACDMAMCDMAMCDMAMCDMAMCDMAMCDMAMCDMAMCDMAMCDMAMCDMAMCDMAMCDMAMCDMAMCDMAMCDMAMCDMAMCDMAMCDMAMCDMAMCDMAMCDMAMCDMAMCDMAMCDMAMCDMAMCDMAMCDMAMCDMAMCDMAMCDMAMCDMAMCDMAMCDMAMCDMAMCDMAMCDMAMCDMAMCDMAMQGSIPRHYWDSSMDAYELLLRDSTAPASAVAVRTRQKLVEDLGG
ncbi:unnamed protein product, partial [Closterium sp. NIES-64]